jgi:hypothetical protein
MADQKDIQNQKDLNNEMSQTKTLEEQIIDLLAKRRGINSDVLSDQQDISNVLQDQIKQQKFLNSEKQLARNLSNQVTKIAQESYSVTKDELGLSKTNNAIIKQQTALEKNIILAKQQQEKFSKMSLEGTVESKKLNAEIARTYSEQAKQAQEISRQIAQTAESSQAISKTSGVKAFGVMGDVADKLGASKIAGPVKEAAEAARAHGAEQIEMNANINKGIGDYKQFRAEGMKMDDALKKAGVSAKQVKVGKLPLKATGTLMAGFKALGPIISKALGPVGLIIEAVKALKVIDSASGTTAKSLGISAAEARELNAEMADAASMSGDLLVSSQDVVKAQVELNKLFGTSVKFSGEFAAEFSAIAEKTGLSSHAMGVFAEKALMSGTSIQKQLEKVQAVTMELNAQNGISINAKDIQEGIGQMSAVQMLNNKMNTKEMAKQVFQAKMLGISQSQLEATQSGLLDFESSIAAEMEAELLTGKQLNLEGARAAALAGDQAKLAAELRKEVGTAAEFGAMNVIQQEAMAKAFNMSREDMAAMLIEQEKLEAVKAAGFASASDAQEMYNKALKDGTLTEEKKEKLAKAGLLAQFESATQQEKMAAAMDKLQDIFIQLMDGLAPIFDVVMDVLTPIFAILSPIAKLIGDVINLVMNVLQPALTALSNAFQKLADGFTDIFGGIADVIVGILTFDFDMLLDGFKSLIRGVLKLVVMPFQAITDLVVGALNTVIRGANYVPGVDISEIESPDLSKSVNSMLGLADGGIIPATPGGIPAIIGEGGEDEVVMPLSKLPGLLKGEESNIDNTQNTNNTQIVGLLKELISAVKEGGDVYIDGNKAGKSLALATSKMG